jgi:hypothetical protein
LGQSEKRRQDKKGQGEKGENRPEEAIDDREVVVQHLMYVVGG